ncbi:MAG: class I SAM-dependent methyltransferase [Ilumatobacter sp.]|uniref:class I SAM-dependent methyltransferase n=1 Tax=Ilumatobacter sp. TaxID=1967498 RepID=UPI00261321D0|nr:class I SAM-dependent methyltransferase [Ilumatobacter sp.]MDJ0768829.1 class I SAM-dependent methyltransferase [Ilumatobacter sp.]
MEGYGSSSYGDAFADVYDEWYRGISDVDTTVAVLAELAGDGPLLELGVGTGRLALPLARTTGVAVVGIDTSRAMLDLLAERDRDGTVDVIVGDMVRDLPDGPFTMAFVAYNTLFNLLGDGEQRACFAAVADRLVPGGRFVVEAFVPEDPPRRGDHLEIRELTATCVVLSASVHHPDDQTAEGQFIELTEAGGVRLRPWSVRYATPAQLDEMAAAAGLELEHRWSGFERSAFDDDASRHVSTYRKIR